MNFKRLNETLKKYICEENEKPFKFTIDYDDGRPEDIIEYGVDEEDAKANLLKTHKYLQGKEERITNIEPVKEDHEQVTLPFTMIHKSSEGPDASGEVTFFPTPFGYEYDCSVKEFNGRGPQWSTIRTIEGIKIWFRNVLFEFGAKIVTIGNETWDIDDFAKNESLNEAESIYSPRLILQAYKKEQEWLKENNYEIGETPDIQLFIIENNQIVGCTYVPRKDVYTYQPEENEYYLDMVRDSGDVLTDYNLEPAQKLVHRWNESRKWESLNEEFKDGEMLKNIEDIKNIYWDPRLDYDQARQKIEEYASKHNLTSGDIQWILGPDSYHNLYMEDDEFDEYDDFDESLKGYKEVAKIIKNDKGYNVAQKDEPMLVEDKSSLKSLLTELAKYL